ncbi:MAG: nucleoside-diphosphate-sugar epimerase [Hyphomicrobiaceae bacterium]
MNFNMKPQSRVLIAGCGYVGCAAAEQLRSQGHQVFGARRDTTQLPPGIEPVAIDLLGGNYDAVPPELDAVVWALSPSSSEAGYRAAYVDGPAALLHHLHQRGDPIARAVLVASTSVWHCEDGREVDEQSPTTPSNFRGDHILAGERAFDDSPFPSTSLRLAGIYGPGRTSMLDRIANGQAEPPEHAVYGNRIWRDDAARAITHILTLTDAGPIYAVADDDPADLRHVYAWLAEQLGVDLPPANKTFHRRSGSKRIRNHLLRASGWSPSVPDFRTGYAQLLAQR